MSGGGLIGQSRLRDSLRLHTGSFAVIGPRGVGKHAAVAEWVDERPYQALTTLADLRGAVARPSLLHILDTTEVRPISWTPLLRPLEEDAFPLVIIATSELPPALASRLSVFRAGYLSDAEVFQVLTLHFPRLSPRPVIAGMAQGCLANINTVAAAAQTWETLDRCLAEGRVPDLFRTDPEVAFFGLRALCRSVLALSSVLPISAEARSAVSHNAAAALLGQPDPTSKHEARNAVALWWADRG